MQFSTIFSLLAVAGSALALPSSQLEQRDECVGSELCCGTLTTPLDPIVDPILMELGINAAAIVGSVGLLCHPYSDDCSYARVCCTEANILSGVLALGCS